MGLLEKAGQIEGDKTSAEKPKVAEPESVKEAPEAVAQPEPVKTCLLYTSDAADEP